MAKAKPKSKKMLAKKAPAKLPPSVAAARAKIRKTAPKLLAYTENLIFEDVWEGPELSKRDRSLITIAALVALYRTGQLAGNIERGLDNGLTREEIVGVITHMAFYSGWPTAMEAAQIATDVFER
jgi:4-carboxymuconolactone decarboxylase